ncbi:microcystin degradation protein MlrC [Chromatiales bacterium (ex Bugula neritina AB1)]|nr:microcystin degradation protein MlrC [Chromatiales bacterium (ex Bugula neritina AB1)]
MNIGIAMMSHETNTFSPVITDLARFSGGRTQPLSGNEALETYRDTASCLGGFIKIASERSANMVHGIAAAAAPSGRVENDAYEYICDSILALAGQVDGLLLVLHGAMATVEFDDGEGELLQRIRARHPNLPVCIALDMHANVTRQMVDNCDVLAGYHTYPHIDMDTTAERAANLFFDMLEGKSKPVMHWATAPMLPHVMRQGTDDFPNNQLQQRAIELEDSSCLAASLFTGFPHADIHAAGVSAVVITNDDLDHARTCANELLDFAWQQRARFVYTAEDLPTSIARARSAQQESGTGPVIILDHYDNTASGGTMDTTEVLAAVIDAKLNDVAVFGFYDPEVVEQMIHAGVGEQVTVKLGGKLPMPALATQSSPLTLTGEVVLISNGKFKAQVAMSRGLTINMGRAAVLRVGGVDIAVISRHIEPYDPACFRALGMEPTQRKYLMLKSRIHYRVGFKPIAKAIIECAGRGVCTSDYDELEFNNVRRPIYPLDHTDAEDDTTRHEFESQSRT